MDKKSVTLGLLFLIGGFALMMYNGTQQQKAQQERLERERQAQLQLQQEEKAIGADDEALVRPALRGTEATIVSAASDALDLARPVAAEDVSPKSRPEEIYILENDYLRISFTTLGGAIKSVELKEYPLEQGSDQRVVLNGGDGYALAISRALGDGMAPFAPVFELSNQTRDLLEFSVTLSSGIVLRRRYELIAESGPGPEPYTIRHSTEFLNPTETNFNIDRLFLNVGTAAPTNADPYGFDLNASYLTRGSYKSIAASKFRGGGIIFKSEPQERIERRGEISWGAVKNQFFTSILTPITPAQAIVATGVSYPQGLGRNRNPMGVAAALEFALPTVEAGGRQTIEANYYVGPKDFSRLSKMDDEQEDVMQLGWFLGMYVGLIAFVAKLMLTLMGGIFSFVGNWGVAIILTTLVIRLLLWPLTAKAAKASKRMQKLQKPIKELQEKYKDDPRKQQEAMLALWKKYKINPLSGCWPVLVQLPIFIAFFNLLRNASDLRFAHFLWIQDLSMPDATIRLGETFLPLVGNSINVLPFVWLVSMYFQMKMMPQPSIDNAQAKIIKFMPFIFFPFTYFFSSGLVLYWTTTNCFSIFQQYITNRRKDADDAKLDEELAQKEKDQAAAPTGPLLRAKKKKKNSNDLNR